MLTKRESVLIADDNSVVRQGLQLFLEESGMEVVGLAADGKQAIEKTQKLDPIMLTAVNDPSTLKHALALGADALLLKDDGPDSLKRAISTALAGNILYIGWDAMKAGAGLA
jgi:DNA-binding NarL/FixJ family response regulator